MVCVMVITEFLGDWNGLWAMVKAGFVGYGGWLAGFGFFFFLLRGFEWSVECRGGGGGWVCAVVVWGLVDGGGLVFAGSVGGCEIVKKFSFC